MTKQLEKFMKELDETTQTEKMWSRILRQALNSQQAERYLTGFNSAPIQLQSIGSARGGGSPLSKTSSQTLVKKVSPLSSNKRKKSVRKEAKRIQSMNVSLTPIHLVRLCKHLSIIDIHLCILVSFVSTILSLFGGLTNSLLLIIVSVSYYHMSYHLWQLIFVFFFAIEITSKYGEPKDINLLDINPKILAEQITYFNLKSIENLDVSQFLLSKDTGERGSRVALTLQRGQQLSLWVASEIVSVGHLKQRVLVLSKFMTLCLNLLRIQDYEGFFNIWEGLHMRGVKRLRNTWQV